LRSYATPQASCKSRELGPVFRIDVFGAPTACFVGPEAFALVLDDKNVARAGANPPHVEELFTRRPSRSWTVKSSGAASGS
jgi:hypothetical protein